MFKLLTYYLFSQLGVGGLVALVPVSAAAGRSFFRFCGIAAFACLALALAVSHDAHPTAGTGFLLASAALALVFVVVVIREANWARRPALAAAAAAGLIGLALDGWQRTASLLPEWAPALTSAYFVVSALFLGSTIFGMILGHWYLVVPTLAIDPLRRLAGLMVAATLAKTLLVVLTLSLLGTLGSPAVQSAVDALAGMRGIFFWARTLFGILGPLVVCYMIWETVKLNATQSATGLLYVATIFALIGEALSRFVFFTTDLPI